MVLGRGLADADGRRHAMAGLLPLETSFQERRLALGYRRARLAADGPLGKVGTAYSRPRVPLLPNVVSEDTGPAAVRRPATQPARRSATPA